MTMPGSSVTMEEIGEQLAAASAEGKAADLASIKLEGDNVPEELRGKTVAELIRDREVLAQSVNIANAARLAAEAKAGSATPVAPVVMAPPPEPQKRLTKEEWDALYETNPMQAIAYMNEIAIQDAAAQFERRFGSLAVGASAQAENVAKAQFKDEFELFGAEIKQLADTVADKSVLANPEGWAHLVSFVRGKPGNFEKLLEARTKKAAEAAANAAREMEAASVGASFSSSTVRTPSSAPKAGGGDTGNFGLDAEERHAADVMGMSYKDYAHWKKIGG